MKAKLLSCIILSTLTSIGMILIMVGSNQDVTYWDSSMMYYDPMNPTLMTGLIMVSLPGIALLVMGILVIISANQAENKGLVLTTGILSLFCGVMFSAAIVGIIAYIKYKPSVFANGPIPYIPNPNLDGVQITGAGGVQPTIAPVPKPKTLEEELSELQTLKEKKLITATEYTSMRKKILEKHGAK